VDEHHFDADPNFHFNVDEDPTPSPIPIAKWGKITFIHSYANLQRFSFLIKGICVLIF
jgi:hypothetical protein